MTFYYQFKNRLCLYIHCRRDSKYRTVRDAEAINHGDFVATNKRCFTHAIVNIAAVIAVIIITIIIYSKTLAVSDIVFHERNAFFSATRFRGPYIFSNFLSALDTASVRDSRGRGSKKLQITLGTSVMYVILYTPIEWPLSPLLSLSHILLPIISPLPTTPSLYRQYISFDTHMAVAAARHREPFTFSVNLSL